MWGLANYLYNYGLVYASITSSVVLSNTSPAWIYIISLTPFMPESMRERLDSLSVAMILVSISGFLLLAKSDRN